MAVRTVTVPKVSYDETILTFTENYKEACQRGRASSIDFYSDCVDFISALCEAENCFVYPTTVPCGQLYIFSEREICHLETINYQCRVGGIPSIDVALPTVFFPYVARVNEDRDVLHLGTYTFGGLDTIVNVGDMEMKMEFEFELEF